MREAERDPPFCQEMTMTTKCVRFEVPLLFLSLALGCSKKAAEKEESSATSAAAQHAPSSAKPGSYEDWCGEHQVAESQCTRCNPDLAPAFKATGDWCEEHGLPESQCLKCNPNLKITRPPQGP
jgi:hypothetical protein